MAAHWSAPEPCLFRRAFRYRPCSARRPHPAPRRPRSRQRHRQPATSALQRLRPPAEALPGPALPPRGVWHKPCSGWRPPSPAFHSRLRPPQRKYPLRKYPLRNHPHPRRCHPTRLRPRQPQRSDRRCLGCLPPACLLSLARRPQAPSVTRRPQEPPPRQPRPWRRQGCPGPLRARLVPRPVPHNLSAPSWAYRHRAARRMRLLQRPSRHARRRHGRPSPARIGRIARVPRPRLRLSPFATRLPCWVRPRAFPRSVVPTPLTKSKRQSPARPLQRPSPPPSPLQRGPR